MLTYLRLIVTALALISNVDCARSSTRTSPQEAFAKVTPWKVTPFPQEPSRPSYLARDFDKPGQPTLSRKEIALVRNVG